MGDAMVESIVRDGSAPLVRVNTTEVMPEAEAHLGKKYATLATTLVKSISVGIAPGVSLIVGFKFHRCLICKVRGGLGEIYLILLINEHCLLCSPYHLIFI